MGQNFIEYAVACNTDRAIPDAKSGLKPVAKRILYGTYDQGFSSSKPHVKAARTEGYRNYSQGQRIGSEKI